MLSARTPSGELRAHQLRPRPDARRWLEQYHPDVPARLSRRTASVARHGVGNALAQAYNHTILPLACARQAHADPLGPADFDHRFGRRAEGMWLAETAVDLETLDLLAEQGVAVYRARPLAGRRAVDLTEPYLVRLPERRTHRRVLLQWPAERRRLVRLGHDHNADTFAASFLPHAPQPGEAGARRGPADRDRHRRRAVRPPQALPRPVPPPPRARGRRRPAASRSSRWAATCAITRRARGPLHAPSAWSCAHGVHAGARAAPAPRATPPGSRRCARRSTS